MNKKLYVLDTNFVRQGQKMIHDRESTRFKAIQSNSKRFKTIQSDLKQFKVILSDSRRFKAIQSYNEEKQTRSMDLRFSRLKRVRLRKRRKI